MRVHLTVLLAVCTATARNTGCDTGWEFPPITQSVAGPSVPVLAAVASPPARGSAVSQFCAGYRAGTIQGWKDLRGAASNPDGHVPQDLLDACPRPT